MHPEIMRDLVAQHGRELHEQAQRAARARTLVRARRAARHAASGAGVVSSLPAVPDYVDGTFQTAGDEAARHVPAARHAA
jgi:hypothetical protein